MADTATPRSFLQSALWRGLAVAPLVLAACSRGEEREFLGPPDTTPVDKTISQVVVVPRLGTVAQGEQLDFAAFARNSKGDSVAADVLWSSSGGQVSSSGGFSAGAPGTYWIVARSLVQAEKADSASVLVVGPDNPLVSVSITPKTVGARIGQPKQFVAKVYHQDGTQASVPVFWTASGGSIGQDGVYLPDSPGDQIVIAVIGAGLVDTAQVRVSETPFLTSILLSPGEDTVAQGASVQYVALAEWSDGGSDLPAIDYSTTGGVIDSTGVFSALALPGDYIVVAKERGGSGKGTAKIRIQAKRVTAIDLSPAVVDLTPGATQRFVATGQDELGVSQQVQVNWSATGGTITSAGSYKAGLTTGTFRVIATQSGGELADTAVVTISTPTATLTQLVLNPSAVTVAAGATTQFSVAGSWSDGSSAAPEVTWSATGGTISDEGDYTAPSSPGTFKVIARHTGGTKADTSTVTVVAPKLVQLSVSPGTASIETYQTKQFNASALWSDGGTTLPPLTWTATGGNVSGSGLFTAGSSPGTYRVIVRDQAATRADTAFVTVSSPEPVLQDIVVNPGSVSLNSGASQQFYVQGVWTNSGSAVPDVTWSATGGTVTSGGRFTAGNTAGTFRVIAVDNGTGIADTAVVTVLPPAPVLTGIVVTPAQATVQPGNVQFFGVSGVWTNGGSGAPAVTWSATGGTINSGGAYTAGSQAGTYRVIARQVGGGFADTASVTIAAAPPALVGLVVSPDSNTVSIGGSQQFSVAGVWTNGGSGAPAVTWSSTGGSITSSGLYTAGSQAGTYRVIATQSGGSLADTATVFVSSSAVALTSLAINPDDLTLQTGMSQEFLVDAHWSNGTTTRPNLDWTATGGGTVSQWGRFTAGNIGGSYKVVARHTNGSLADTADVHILAPAVTKLTLTPKSVSVPVGGTQQFSVSATWSDGVSRPVAVTYKATGGSIGVNGLFLAGQVAGVFPLIAACGCGAPADTAFVTVTSNGSAATLVSLSVSPASVTLAPGASQTFGVMGSMSDGTTNSSVPVTWTAQGGTMAGNTYTAGSAPGSFKLIGRATSASVADTVAITVVAIAPPPPGNQDPVPSGTILLDTRQGGPQSIQNSVTVQDALNAIQSSSLVRRVEQTGAQFATDIDGQGTRGFRMTWPGWNGVQGGVGRRVRVYFGLNPRPKKLYVQWKNWMGRTPTGGGIGAIGAFDVTNQLDPVGNAGRKYMLLMRDVPGLGNEGRTDVVWAGPSPVRVQMNFVNLNPNPGNLKLNRLAWDPEAHYNQVITYTMYFQAESYPGAQDGIIRIWYDGILRMEYLNVATGDAPVDRINMSDTFESPIQDQTEYFWDLVIWSP